jgi:hypothetical protein
MPKNETNTEYLQRVRSDCRREVLAYLAEREGLAMQIGSIHRGLRGHSFSLADVTEALNYHESRRFLTVEGADFGAPLAFQVTKEGVKAHRGG